MTRRSGAPGPNRLLADYAPAEALRRLELTIVRRLEGYLRGEHLGLRPGPGSEVGEARAYRPGEDDVRHMDWAVTARTTQPHVRDVVADRELETWALVDLTASMDFGMASRDKRDIAVAAVATVGVLTQRAGDRFGGYVLREGRRRRWPARSGRLALYGLLRSLLDEPRSDVSAGGPAETGSLAAGLDALGRGHPRRGLRLVVSDFNEPAAFFEPGGGQLPWERPMRRLGARHQVIAVQVVDPRESHLPDVSVVELTDPETGAVLEVDTGRRAVREAYAAGAAAHAEQVRVALRRAGCAHLVLRTDADWVTEIARFVLSHRRVARQLHAPRRGMA